MDFEKSLTNAQIIEAFPEQCEKLVPKLLRHYRREIKPYLRECKNVRLRHFDRHIEVFMLGQLKIWYKPDVLETHIKRLEDLQTSMLPVEEGRLTENQILIAKSIPIATLFNFQKIKTGHGRFSACCPFHSEKTPSFVVYPNNTYYCFGCHEAGDSIKFVEKINGVKFIDSVRFLLTKQ